MKRFTYILIAAALAAISCNKEAEQIEVPVEEEGTYVTEPQTGDYVTVTFRASTDASTKVSISEGSDGEKKASWQSTDAIKIIWYDSAQKDVVSSDIDIDGGDSSIATFTFSIPSGDLAGFEAATAYYAVYPSTVNATLDGDSFSVAFPDDSALATSFAGAAWSAAKTTTNAFSFHPISTVVKFTVNGSKSGSPTKVYFRGMNGGGQYRGTTAITFDDEPGYPLTVGTPTGGAANVTGKISGVGTYYLPLPGYGASTTDGFILQLKMSGEKIPAAYFSANIVSTPGKFYNIKTDVDNKIITDYYVAPVGSSEAGNPSLEGYGTTLANPAVYTWIVDNIAAFKYYDTMSAAFILNGATIHLMGSDTAYDTPLSTMFPTSNKDYYNYTIQGGAGSGISTFTTSAASTFSNAKSTATLKDITFSGCDTAPAISVSDGNVNLDNVDFSSCSANAIAITGGTFKYNEGTVSGCSASSAVVVSNAPTVSINGVTLSNNNSAAAKINGAALRIATSSTASVSLEGCIFSGNKAGSGTGGAIHHNGTSANLEVKDCKFISNSCTGNSGGAICAANTVTGHIYITGCIFYGNTTGTQYGSAIHCANKKASEQVFLGINNSLFYNNGIIKGTSSEDGNATVVICGKHIIMNSTLISTSNLTIRCGYNNGGSTAHTNYGGSLLLNNIISNESSDAAHYALNTINTNYTIRCNGYNYYSSKNRQVQVSAQDVECALTKDTDYTWNPSTYSWTWTPSAAQKENMASYATLRALVNNDQYNATDSDVHDEASAFLTWLESLEYEYSSYTYNAFQVDINGRPRNTSAYWPGCYQND